MRAGALLSVGHVLHVVARLLDVVLPDLHPVDSGVSWAGVYGLSLMVYRGLVNRGYLGGCQRSARTSSNRDSTDRLGSVVGAKTCCAGASLFRTHYTVREQSRSTQDSFAIGLDGLAISDGLIRYGCSGWHSAIDLLPI